MVHARGRMRSVMPLIRNIWISHAWIISLIPNSAFAATFAGWPRWWCHGNNLRISEFLAGSIYHLRAETIKYFTSKVPVHGNAEEKERRGALGLGKYLACPNIIWANVEKAGIMGDHIITPQAIFRLIYAGETAWWRSNHAKKLCGASRGLATAWSWREARRTTKYQQNFTRRALIRVDQHVWFGL